MGHSISRRTFVRTAAAGSVALALATRATSAQATLMWCRREPLIRVNGRLVDLYAVAEEGILEACTGPVQMTCFVPAGAAVEYISSDNGFGYGYSFAFAEDASLKVTPRGYTRIRVETIIPANQNLRIMVEVLDVESGVMVSSTRGRTNRLEVTRARV